MNLKVASVIVAIILFVNSVVLYISFELMSIPILLSTIFVYLIFRRVSTKNIQLNQKYQLAMEEKEKVNLDNNKIMRKLEHYEQFFNSFEGATFYIFDNESREYKFSKGVEKLFGFTQKQLNEDVNLWKSLVHPEDIQKVKDAEDSLAVGQPVHAEIRIIHSQFGEKWILHIANPFKDSLGEIKMIHGKFMDISKQKELENDLRYMAFFDDLTDLPNRKMLDMHIQKAFSRSKRRQHNFSLMFIDLDDFKLVNDTLGHDAGDQLLKDVSARMNDIVREEDLVARIGGDEFIIVFEETGKEELEEIAQRMIQKVSEPYYINGEEARISLSIGVSTFPEDGYDKETLMQNADKAMYFAKNNGKNAYRLFTPDLEDTDVGDQSIFQKWMNVFQNVKIFK